MIPPYQHTLSSIGTSRAGFAQRWSTNVGTININIVPVGTSSHTLSLHYVHILCSNTLSICLINMSYQLNTSFQHTSYQHTSYQHTLSTLNPLQARRGRRKSTLPRALPRLTYRPGQLVSIPYLCYLSSTNTHFKTPPLTPPLTYPHTP